MTVLEDFCIFFVWRALSPWGCDAVGVIASLGVKTADKVKGGGGDGCE